MAWQQSSGPVRATCLAGAGAGACFVLALLVFGAALDGYDHAAWPVALLGAEGVPRATLFNLSAFVLPGLLAAVAALGRRGGLPVASGLPVRLGWTLALLAAVAFVMQGVFPLDPSAPDAGRGRLHGVAWALWGLAFAAAGAMLAMESLRLRRPWQACGHLVAGTLAFALAWWGGDVIPAALAQRAAFLAWFAWLACTGCGAFPRGGARVAGRGSLR